MKKATILIVLLMGSSVYAYMPTHIMTSTEPFCGDNMIIRENTARRETPIETMRKEISRMGLYEYSLYCALISESSERHKRRAARTLLEMEPSDLILCYIVIYAPAPYASKALEALKNE